MTEIVVKIGTWFLDAYNISKLISCQRIKRIPEHLIDIKNKDIEAL